jgi:hypothetical protein
MLASSCILNTSTRAFRWSKSRPSWLWFAPTSLAALSRSGSRRISYAHIAASADFHEAFQGFLRCVISLTAEVYRVHDLFIPIGQARLHLALSKQGPNAPVPVEFARSCLEAAILQNVGANNSTLVNRVQTSWSDPTEQPWLIWVQ